MIFNKESDFEEALIKILSEKGWEKEVLKNYSEQDLLQNWANILFENNRDIDRLNDYPLTDGEMQQILEQIKNLRTPLKLNGFINGKSVSVIRDNPEDKLHFGKEVSLKIYDRREIAAGTDGDDIPPAGNAALTVDRAAHGDDRAVSAQTHSVPLTSAYGDNICPVRNFTLLIKVVSDCDHSSVRFQTEDTAVAGAHSDDITPVRNIALAILVRACGDDSTVRSQADGVRAIGAEGGLVEQCVIYAERKFRGLRFFVLGFFVFRTEFLTLAQRQADILPVGNAALVQIGADGNCGAVGFEPDSVIPARAHSNDISPAHDIAAVLIFTAGRNDRAVRLQADSVP